MGFSLLICQIGIQGVPFIQNRCIRKWICISKELNKYKVPNQSSCQCYLPLAHPPGVQLVFHGQGRAEPGISLPHVPTDLQGQGLGQAQCLAQGKGEHCKVGSKRERGMRPGREGTFTWHRLYQPSKARCFSPNSSGWQAVPPRHGSNLPIKGWVRVPIWNMSKSKLKERQISKLKTSPNSLT